MVAKKTEDKKESLENMEEEMDDVFDSPRMRCLTLKTEFLKKAKDYRFWGHDKSRQRVVALDTFLQYCNKSMDLADFGTELRNDVHQDIKSFLQDYDVIPVPHSVREKLCYQLDCAMNQIQEIPYMMSELHMLHKNAVKEFEKEEWSKLKGFNQDSHDLRVLRKKIYTGEKQKHGTGQQWVIGVLSEDIDKYEWQVKDFLKKYKKILSKHEIVIWKKKLKDTIEFAKEILDPWSLDDEIIEDKEDNSESLAQEVESIEPKVEEIFDATKKQELLVETLTNVPADTEGFFDDHSSVDENIEARLLKLKFFRQTWCPSEPGNETEPVAVTPAAVTETSEPKRKSEVVEEVATCTTEEETEMFNNWYLTKIGFISPPSSDIADAKVEAEQVDVSSTDPWTGLHGSESSKHDESIDELPAVFMDKDVDHTKNLSSPCPRNEFKGSTSHSLPSNLYFNIENILVMLLTVLRMLNFAQPKLSYVPAVFPTQSQSYPDPSVPSPAHCPSSGPIMNPMEMRLTRTSSKQVVMSHMTEGYLSWFSGRVWEILQQVKISAGLRLIEAGEMLLA